LHLISAGDLVLTNGHVYELFYESTNTRWVQVGTT